MLATPVLLLSCFLSAAGQADDLQVVTERNVAVPVRDGTILRADVHRPDQGGPYPVLVFRTPYGKNKRFDRYVKAGYIVVAQDARGRFASDGQFESFMRFQTHDGVDGFDTVQWAVRLPNSTGKVGTFGVSYNSFLQWRLAPMRPPSLVAMSAHSITARLTDVEGPGTIRPGRRLQWWIGTMGPDMLKRSGRAPSDAFLKLTSGKKGDWIWFLPWTKLPWEVFGPETEAVHYWLKNPHTDPWKLDEGCQEIAVPNLDVVGWYDHCNGDMRLWRAMSSQGKTETARRGSRLVVGPWGHSTRGVRRFGPIDFGPEASPDLVALEIRWFDHWLKGVQNGVDRDAPVRIFVMGDNRWRDEHQWPLRRAKEKVLYLATGGRANTPAGNGRLVDTSAANTGADHYVYDPKKPVPSLWTGFTAVTDQRPLADREDILVYQTEPLAERIEVTGNPVVELYATSSAPDTDWFVRLIDVTPDGLARDVSMGMVRARYREGLDKPKLLKPGELVKYTIRMNPMSNAFLAGHRIRLDVTSSDFPNYDRNHNTSADQNANAELKTADQTIHHGGATATRIVLPWIPSSN